MPVSVKAFFDRPALKGAARAQNLRACVEAYPDRLTDQRFAKRVLQRITMPADATWAYGSNQKAASTTTYAALFELTFGIKLSAKIDDGLADWTDQAPQNMDQAQVFYQLAQFEGCVAAMDNAFRFSVVRNPIDRAASSFHFICYAQSASLRQFYADRVRLNILGFDWDTDMYTETGFRKFLHYAEQEAALERTEGRLADPHFRPQWMNMSLEFLDPHLVFRVDDLAEGLDTLTHNLGHAPLQRNTTNARLNTQPKREPYLGAQDLVEHVYARDFEIYESASCRLRKDWTIPEQRSKFA